MNGSMTNEFSPLLGTLEGFLYFDYKLRLCDIKGPIPDGLKRFPLKGRGLCPAVGFIYVLEQMNR